ncbi:hypothetical protein JCM3774_001887 [Rhodotorula dairenensis]
MSVSAVSPVRAGLGLGGIALPHELLGSDDREVETMASMTPKRPARPPLPQNSLSSPGNAPPSSPSPTAAAFPRATPLRSSRSGSVQHVTSDMISYPVMSARFEAVATAGSEPISPNSKGRNAVGAPMPSKHPKGTSDGEKRSKPRPAPIKTGSGSSSSSGFFSPLRHKFSAFGLGGKEQTTQDDGEVSPTREVYRDGKAAEQPSAPRRRQSDPSAQSPPACYTETSKRSATTSKRRPSEVHRRAVSDSPAIFSQAQWRPPVARTDTGSPVPDRYPEEVVPPPPQEALFLSASHAGADGEQHFGQIPFSGEGGAVVRIRSSRRPDELEIGWTCVSGIDALGVPFTTWEVSLRPRRAPHSVISAVPRSETARPSRKPSAVSFQSYTMHSSSTQPAQNQASDMRAYHRGAESAATSPTRSRVRPRFASSGYDESLYGSVSSDASLWGGPGRPGKMSISTAATSEPEDCYSPIDLTAYGVTPDSTPPAATGFAHHRTERSSSYAPGMAPFLRSRQFSIDPETASKSRSFSLSTLGSTASRESTLHHVEGYGEEISVFEHAPQPPRRESLSAKSSRPSVSVALDRRPSTFTKPHLPSPLSRRQYDLDEGTVDPRTPINTQSMFSGPPLCPLPEVPTTTENKSSPKSRFSTASSLEAVAADVQTATIQRAEQLARETASSRWSDNDEE